MSKLITDKLRTVDGTKEIDLLGVAQGSSKAWVNFDGTGAVSVRNSFNVSSLVDQGVGQYQAHWSNPFTGDDYVNVTDASMTVSSNDDCRTGAIAADNVQLRNYQQNNPFFTDPSLFMSTAHGDLA